MKNPLTGAYVFLSGEVNEACLVLNLRNHDGRHEKLLTMRLYFLSLFHNNTTKGYHSCDKFIYPLYNDRLQARQFAPGGDSYMEQTGMLVGNFEFNP